jgi:hypothetical protein
MWPDKLECLSFTLIYLLERRKPAWTPSRSFETRLPSDKTLVYNSDIFKQKIFIAFGHEWVTLTKAKHVFMNL